MMVSQWMVYSVLTAALVSAAAVAVDVWFRSVGRPVRWVWAAAPAVSLLVPLLALASGGRYPGRLVPLAAPAGSWRGVFPLVESGGFGAASSQDAMAGFGAFLLSDGVLAGIWVLATLLAGAWYAGVWRRLARSSRSWRRARVAGSSVLVSRNGGPAAVGLIRPSIVVPEWLLGASEVVQSVVLKHEAEHVRARDHALLALAPLTVILFPWNLALWWQVRRLRLAVELDCDRRVLASGVDVETYASLLLEIASRPRSHVLAVPLARPDRRPLETRLKAMTRSPLRWLRLRVFGSMVASAFLLAVACETDPPLTAAPDSAVVDAARTNVAALLAAGSFANILDDVESGRVQVFVDGERVSGGEIERLRSDEVESIEIMKGALSAPDFSNTRLISGRIYIRTKAAAGSVDPVDLDARSGLRDVREESAGASSGGPAGPGAAGVLRGLMESKDPLAGLPADAEWFLDGRPATRSDVRALERAAIARIEVRKEQKGTTGGPPQVRVFSKGGGRG